MLEERIEPTDHDSKRYNESAGKNVSKRDVEAETIDRSHPVIFKETRICPPKSELIDDTSDALEAKETREAVLEVVGELPKTKEEVALQSKSTGKRPR